MVNLEKYGNTRVAKIRATFNWLRQAIRSGDIEEAEAALDRYEQWADFILSKDEQADQMDTIRDAAENALIAYSMGWDQQGTMEVLKEALEYKQSSADTK